MVDLLIPGFRAMHPMGPRLPGVRARSPRPDFRSIISRGSTACPYAALDTVRGRHGPGVPMASHVPAAPAVAPPTAALGPQVARAHLVPRCAPRRIPGRVLVQTHRDPLRIIASLWSLEATLRSDRDATTRPSPKPPTSWPTTSSKASTVSDRSTRRQRPGPARHRRPVRRLHGRPVRDDPSWDLQRLDLEFTGVAESRIREFLVAHSQAGRRQAPSTRSPRPGSTPVRYGNGHAGTRSTSAVPSESLP